MGSGQTVTIIISMCALALGGGVYLHSDIKSMSSRMDSRMDTQSAEHSARMDAQSARMDTQGSEHSAKMDAQYSRMDAQSARTDQLYQMFVDLLKERK